MSAGAGENLWADFRFVVDVAGSGADGLIHLHNLSIAELLFEARHVVVGCATNPVMQRPLDATTYFASGHVATSVSRDGTFSSSAEPAPM